MTTPIRSRATSAVLLAAALIAPSLQAQEGGAEAFGVALPELKAAVKAPREVPSRRVAGALDSRFRLAPQVALSTVDHDALLREDTLREVGSLQKVMRFSLGRPVALSARDGAWTDLPDGSRLWVADVVSPGALGMRLRFSDLRLPAGAELAVWGEEPDVTAAGAPAKAAAAEFHFGGSASRPELWTRTFAGERAHVEYLVPAGAATGEELPFRLDRLQHVYRDPVADWAKAAGPCHNDISCFPQYQALANAVSGIGTVGSGDGIWCTGQLLNVSAKKPDFTPYWLGANHCLDSQVDASFAEFFWFYQTGSCGGAAPSVFSVPRSVGATLLSTNPTSDYTLLLIEGALPPGLYWSGWTSKKIGNGADAVGIHHPSGDFKRISFAEKQGTTVCNQAAPGRKLVDVAWTDGPTEPGSSGSGIFLTNGQLFGQLLGGPSACGNETFDCYGAFATTFPRIKNLLKGGSDDKSDQNDSCNQARLIKPGVIGGRIVKVTDVDWYRISVPAGKSVLFTVDFSHGNGDVDLEAFATCKGGAAIALSDGVTNSEEVRVTNVGNKAAFLYLRVFLASDVRNSYDMSALIY